jgi:hypothetical protein
MLVLPKDGKAQIFAPVFGSSEKSQKRGVIVLQTLRRSVALSVLALVLTCPLARSVELNPAAVTFKLPDQIEWKTPPSAPAGAEIAVLAGDPSKPGLYVVMVKMACGQ